MTEDEALKKLKEIGDNCDNEEMHWNADALLLKILRQNGYSKLADQYEELQTSFWYA